MIKWCFEGIEKGKLTTYIPASDRADGGVSVAQISQSAAINAALASQERKQ